MNVLMLTRLEQSAGGGASYSQWLIEALEKQGVTVKTTSSFWKAVFSREKLVHIQHEPLFYGNVKSVLFPFLIPLLRWRGKKVVITYHGVFNKENLDFYALHRYPMVQGLAKALIHFIFGVSSKYADLLIVHSASLGEDLKKQFPSVSDKIRVVHHGIITKNRIMKPHEKRTVSMFGFFGEHQDNWLLLEAAKYLPEICFNVRREWVEDLDSFLSETDLFVMPENHRVSTSGVLFIAVGYGIPVLVYDDPVFRDLDLDMFETRDPKELAQIISRVINDDKVLAELSEKSRALAEKDNWFNIAGETKKIYESLIVESSL